LAVAISGSTFFAGNTPDGVFRSLNNGYDWEKINTGLDCKDVTSLVTNGAYLYAGTNKAGVWSRPLWEIVGLNESEPYNENIKLYPNPAKDKVYLDTPQHENTEIEIMGLDGRTIQHTSLQSISTPVDLKGLVNGVYMVKIITRNGITVKRLIKD
jgi:hypothetical protein